MAPDDDFQPFWPLRRAHKWPHFAWIATSSYHIFYVVGESCFVTITYWKPASSLTSVCELSSHKCDPHFWRFQVIQLLSFCVKKISSTSIRYFGRLREIVTWRNFELSLCFYVSEPRSDHFQNGQNEERVLAQVHRPGEDELWAESTTW